MATARRFDEQPAPIKQQLNWGTKDSYYMLIEREYNNFFHPQLQLQPPKHHDEDEHHR
jgi:hypothetical protein